MRPDLRSDQLLIDAVNRGDLAAFDVLYHRHRDWVVRLAFRFTRDHHDSLDVLQETFAWLLGRLSGLKLSARLTTLLYPVVRNLSINVLRARGRFVSADEILDALPDPGPDPAEPLKADLVSVLAQLSAPHREVLLMRFLDGMTVAEIALVLQVPSGTVKSRLHNALALLRSDKRTRNYFLE